MENDNLFCITECERIIETHLKSSHFKVIGHVLQPFSKSTAGFMGEHLLLKIKILVGETQSEPTFFVKRSLLRYPLSSEFDRRMKTYPREILTYQVLLEKFNMVVPNYHVDFVPKYFLGKDDNLLVLENLGEEGFVMATTFGMEEIKLALETVAKYHAGSLAYEEIKSAELRRNYRLIDEYFDYMEEPNYNKNAELAVKYCTARLCSLKSLIEFVPFKKLSVEEFKNKLEKLADEAYAITESNRFRNVLCHGDLWGNNILFKYEEGIPKQCKFVDFALQQYSPPARDVLFFLYMATSEHMRQINLQKLLNHYYEALKTELRKAKMDVNEILPLCDFEGSVRFLTPKKKLHVAYIKTLTSISDEFLVRLAKDVTKFEEFLFGNSAPLTVELFQTETRYKQFMTDTLLELEDMFTHSGVMIEDISLPNNR